MKRMPELESPVSGETARQATARRSRNRMRREEWSLMVAEQCAVCGLARVNVVHEDDPATAPEGPDYYADMLDRLHPFVALCGCGHTHTVGDDEGGDGGCSELGHGCECWDWHPARLSAVAS